MLQSLQLCNSHPTDNNNSTISCHKESPNMRNLQKFAMSMTLAVILAGGAYGLSTCPPSLWSHSYASAGPISRHDVKMFPMSYVAKYHRPTVVAPKFKQTGGPNNDNTSLSMSSSPINPIFSRRGTEVSKEFLSRPLLLCSRLFTNNVAIYLICPGK